MSVVVFPIKLPLQPVPTIIEDMEAAKQLEGKLCTDILRLASRRARDRKRIERKQQRLELLRQLMGSIE